MKRFQDARGYVADSKVVELIVQGLFEQHDAKKRKRCMALFAGFATAMRTWNSGDDDESHDGSHDDESDDDESDDDESNDDESNDNDSSDEKSSANSDASVNTLPNNAPPATTRVVSKVDEQT